MAAMRRRRRYSKRFSMRRYKTPSAIYTLSYPISLTTDIVGTDGSRINTLFNDLDGVGNLGILYNSVQILSVKLTVNPSASSSASAP